MTMPRFDIFRIDKDGSLFWIGTANDTHETQELVTQNLSRSKDFLLFDLKTGAKIPMRAGNVYKSQHLARGWSAGQIAQL
jgi:hypothetical protein